MEDFEFNKKFVKERRRKKRINKKIEENEDFDQHSGDEKYKMRSRASIGSETFKKST